MNTIYRTDKLKARSYFLQKRRTNGNKFLNYILKLLLLDLIFTGKKKGKTG